MEIENKNILNRLKRTEGQIRGIQKMIEDGMLTEEEQGIYRRGRNAKSYTSAKNTDIMTYRMSTGFEALMGYLHLLERKERLEELIAWCLEKAGETNEG